MVTSFTMESVLEKYGKDLSFDRVAIQRIRDASESAKIELSTRTATRIQIPYIAKSDAGPIDIDLELTRDKLEELTKDLVERTIQTCQRIFDEAGTRKDQIDEVLLVGGQSRMPLVQSRVTEFMGRPPSKGVHPDEAVGIGAAIMANSLAGSSGGDVTLLDVLPMPIGINKTDGTMHVLFQKNQPLPDYKTRTLTTSRKNQRSILLKIYQGESRLVAENEELGTFVFNKIRPAEKGEVQIEVTFYIDSEGILNLTARDKETDQTVEATLKLNQNKPKKPKAEETPKEEAPKGAPLPLQMPLSSLMQSIGGEDEANEAEGPPPEPRTELAPSPNAVAQRLPPVAPTEAPPEEPRGSIVAQRTEESGGFFSKVVGWFRGLFGGK